jgi:hypothetical protein
VSTRGSGDYAQGRRRSGTAQVPRASLRERGAEATRALREALHLPHDLSDSTILGTALAEIAAQEAQRNPSFAREVRSRYDELIVQRGRPATRTAQEELPPLVPIGHVPGMRIDPSAPPNPRELSIIYGHHQLARALQDYSLDSLKRAADIVQQRHPGTKPANRGRKDAVIAYIVEYSGKESI